MIEKMPSYDTISYWLGIEILKGIDLLSEIPNYLSNTKEIYCKKTNQLNINGNIENIDVSVKEYGVFLTGSINKYYWGDNQQAISRGEVIRANEKLSDNSHLPINNAKVLRIDIASNFIMKYPEQVYYDFLGILSRFKRDLKDNGLYYYNSDLSRKNASMELLFYGKLYEQILKKQLINNLITDKNYLRYEARFLKRLPKRFNIAEITGKTLTDEKFYIDVINKWKELYFSIQKNKITNFDLTNFDMKKPKEYLEFYTLFGIMQRGGEAEALKELETLQKRGIFDKKQAYDLRKQIIKLCEKPNITADSKEIEELDKDIKQAVKYYR